MTFLQAFLLGLVQGLGEFLPISSSAHLIILPWLAHFPDPGLSFDVALHFGTLIAVVAYFWRDWFEIAQGSYQYLAKPAERTAENHDSFYLLLYLIAATIPAAIAGKLLEHWAETTLRNPLLIAFDMVAMGILLLVADRSDKNSRTLRDITLATAIAIGVAQVFALFPGVSRSGVTITMALFLGFNRPSAARFSFLLSTPIIFGACLLKYKFFLTIFNDPYALIGIITSTVFGFLSIRFVMKLVQNSSYRLFVYYRFAFGAAVVLAYFLRS
jgi:undecaprenyl-diphosphatase